MIFDTRKIFMGCTRGQAGFTLVEVLVASGIASIFMFILISMILDFRRLADGVRSQLVIRDYLTSSLNNIRANPGAHQMYFSSNTAEVRDFLNDEIAIAFDSKKFTSVSACPNCPGRAGFVIHPLELHLYRGVYHVRFCALWERGGLSSVDCDGRGINFIVSH
jgi:prepilin-type N-terminal cleavage/methylation domain-containing protein